MQSVRLAIDAANGDHGYSVVVKGVIDALAAASESIQVHLCGERSKIEQALIENRFSSTAIGSTIVIEDALDHAGHTGNPSGVWKSEPRSSIIRCVALQKEGQVDASISAGDTGILMPASLFLLGRAAGASRPAIAAFLPTTGTNPVLVLDVGANLECRVDHLVDFGLMGSDYMGRFFGIATPRVKLLNIGHEATKGTRTVSEAGRVLQRRCPGYEGFIEGSEVLAGRADVVVCDGFIGNVLLKSCESFYRLAEGVLGGRDASVLDTIKTKMAIFNPESYGAAPILGVRGIVFKAHGNSSARAIARAVAMTVTAVRQNVIHPGT